MAKKGSTIENRVYLFREMAAAFLEEHGRGLASGDPTARGHALAALADIAFVACAVADTAKLDARAVADAIAKHASAVTRADVADPEVTAGEHPRRVAAKRGKKAEAAKDAAKGAAKDAAPKATKKAKKAKPKKRRAKARAQHVATG